MNIKKENIKHKFCPECGTEFKRFNKKSYSCNSRFKKFCDLYKLNPEDVVSKDLDITNDPKSQIDEDLIFKAALSKELINISNIYFDVFEMTNDQTKLFIGFSILDEYSEELYDDQKNSSRINFHVFEKIFKLVEKVKYTLGFHEKEILLKLILS